MSSPDSLQHSAHKSGNKRWVRLGLNFFRFVFSWKGIVTLIILIPVVAVIWLASVLGEWRIFLSDTPKLSGIFGTKNYLVLLQNENELRPTGGFITSYGVLHVHGWNISMELFSSEDVALPQPEQKAPDAIETIFSADPKYAGWVFRDSNFALDFAQNAEQAVRFLQFDPRFAAMDFQGVLALDSTVLEQMVDLLGPFEFNGTELTSENFFTLLQTQAKNFDLHDRVAWENRKDAFAPLAQQILTRALGHPSRWAEFAALLTKNADQKHLLLYFPESGLQDKARQKGWSGEIPSTPFWTVNFANLGGRKADRFMRKEFNSSLHVAPNGLITERFSIYLAHEGTYNLQSDRYTAFVRIVRPQGSTLTDSAGTFETAPKQHSTSFGEEISFFAALDPGEEKLLTFEFALPESFSFSANAELSLNILKQPGTDSIPWNITWRGENDVSFAAQGCTTTQSRENVLFCAKQLDTDTILSFTRLADRTPPLLQFARFVDDQTIEARFSEDIFPEISGQDIALTEGGQQVPVGITAKVDGEKIFITLQAVLDVRSTEFQLTIKNLRDISGNFYKTPAGTGGDFATTIIRENAK